MHHLKIGHVIVEPPLILAPIAGVTNPPFRLICREMGAGLVVTEMVSARTLVDNPTSQAWRLDVEEKEHPVAIQLFGGEESFLAAASVEVQKAGADIVDLNMGCPMKKVVQKGYGAALLLDPEKVYRLIKAMVEAVDIPVTAKIRSGWKEANIFEIVEAIEKAGASALAIHARTRSAMFEGDVDRSLIAEVKRRFSLPIIANGNIHDIASARQMLEETQADALMIARAAMGYPWIFRELAAFLAGEMIPPPPDLDERLTLILKHLDLYRRRYDDFRTMMEFRKHLLWYFSGTPGEKILRHRFPKMNRFSDLYETIQEAAEACRKASEPFEFPRGLKKHPNRPSTQK